MILQALTQQYEALAARGEIAKPGWSYAKVSFALRIAEDGELRGVIPLRQIQQRGKKEVEVSQSLCVPRQKKRTSGIDANFLCDGMPYFLGINGGENARRAADCFADSRKLHLEFLQDARGKAAQAVRGFFSAWDPAAAEKHEALSSYLQTIAADTGMLVFYIDGAGYAHEDPEIAEIWEQKTGERGAEKGAENVMQCLVTGRVLPAAQLHGAIKGVKDAQSSGASLVSFNAPAYESYGREQGLNAPVSEYAEFAYTTALNHLLADTRHRQTIGDMTVVYWAQTAQPQYQEMFSLFLNPQMDDEAELHAVMEHLSRAEAIDGIDLKTRFYVLGLSPNAARLSVRFFLQDSFGAMLENLRKHYERLSIAHGPREREYLSVWALTQETVNKNIKDKEELRLLSGALLRAVLSGGRYPQALANAVLMRVRAEQDNADKGVYKITRGRAAILKAWLIRNRDKEGIGMALNENRTDAPYVMGRLFAVLEGVQRTANPTINATIKDRYFNSACATPAVVFPLLLKLKNNHMRKIDSTGSRIYYEKRLGALMTMLETFPKHQTLEEQSEFIIGYYHEVQKQFEGKEKEEK